MYIYFVVCYRVIVALYVRNICHFFAYLYTLDDDSEPRMDYETSLLPKLKKTNAPMTTLYTSIQV